MSYNIIECDLESLSHMTTHHFDNKGSFILIESYDACTNVVEGFQIFIKDYTNKSYESLWKFEYKDDRLIKFLEKKNIPLNVIHIAYDNKVSIVKVDVRISLKNIRKIEDKFQSLENFHLVKELFGKKFYGNFNGKSPAVNLQIYKDGSRSIEFINITQREDFLKYCLETGLLNGDQVNYIDEFSSCKMFSIKFKWVEQRLQRKLYYRVNK